MKLELDFNSEDKLIDRLITEARQFQITPEKLAWFVLNEFCKDIPDEEFLINHAMSYVDKLEKLETIRDMVLRQ